MGELRKHTWPHTLMNLCSGSIDESPGVGANCSTDWFRECCTSNSGKWCQPLMPVVKYRTTNNFGRAFFNQLLGDMQTLLLGKGAQFCDLRFNAQNLLVLHIGGLAGVEKIFVVHAHTIIGQSKSETELNRTGGEPRLGQPRGAAHRAERRGFVGAKRLGGALRRQPKSRSIFRKSDFGVSLQFGSNSFYPKSQKTDKKPRSARQKRILTLGRAKRKEVGGMNFCPPSLSVAAEFRISLCEMRRKKI